MKKLLKRVECLILICTIIFTTQSFVVLANGSTMSDDVKYDSKSTESFESDEDVVKECEVSKSNENIDGIEESKENEEIVEKEEFGTNEEIVENEESENDDKIIESEAEKDRVDLFEEEPTSNFEIDNNSNITDIEKVNVEKAISSLSEALLDDKTEILGELEEEVVANPGELEEEVVASPSETKEVVATLSEINSNLYKSLYSIDNDSVDYVDGVVVLKKNVEVSEEIIIDKDEVLNLNSFSITNVNEKPVFIQKTNKFIIKDDSTKAISKFGEIISNSKNGTIIVKGGTIELNGGRIKNTNYDSQSTIVVENASVKISGAGIYGSDGKDYTSQKGGNGGDAISINWTEETNTLFFEKGSVKGGNGGAGKSERFGLEGFALLVNGKQVRLLEEDYSDGIKGQLGGGNGGFAININSTFDCLNNVTVKTTGMRGGNGGNEYTLKTKNVLFGASAYEEYFNSYDAGYIKRVQNQGPTGACMIFAYTGVAEAYMGKHYPSLVTSLGYEPGKIDLSEEALAIVVDYGQNDPLGNATRGYRNWMHGTSKVSGKEAWAGYVANELDAALFNGWGMIEEKNAPFRTRDNSKLSDDVLKYDNNVLSISKAYSLGYHSSLDDAYLDEIKAGIKANGAVFVGSALPDVLTEKDLADRCNEVKGYFASNATLLSKIDAINGRYSSLPCNVLIFTDGDSGGGHGFSVVGWDDNFPKELFMGNGKFTYGHEHDTKDLTRDGAFLCRNSWYTDQFQWVPYELAKSNFSFRNIEFREKTDHLYYCDGGVHTFYDSDASSNPYKVAANIFKISGGSSTEIAKGVSVDLSRTWASSAEIRLYRVSDNSKTALDTAYSNDANIIGRKALTDNDFSKNTTIFFDDEIILNKDEYVAVAIVSRSGMTISYDDKYSNSESTYVTEVKNKSYVLRNGESNFKTLIEGAGAKNDYGTSGVPGNLTLKLLTNDYNAVKHSLNMDANGGTFSSNSSSLKTVEVSEGASIGSYLETPVKSGYRFVKWVDNVSSPTMEYTATSKMPTTDLTIYAVWQQEWTVTFDTDGGSTIEEVKVLNGEKVTKPTDPTKANYRFVKWVKDGESVEFNFETTITSDIRLKAIWVKQVKITFKDKSTYGSKVYKELTIDENTTIPNADIPVESTGLTKTGYVFDKWVDGSDVEFNFSTAISSDTIVYATWLTALVVTFKKELSDATAYHTVSVLENDYLTSADYPTTNPTKTDYTFVCWVKSGESTEFAYATTPITSNIILVAKWQENPKVIFDTDGGSTIASIHADSNGKVPKPSPDPEKLGFVFDKWVKEDGVTEFIFETDRITTDTTLKAIWIAGKIVTFDSDGGSVVSPITVLPGGSVTKPSNPTKLNYTFDKWVLSDGAEYVFGTPVNDDIVLKAVWIYSPVSTPKEIYSSGSSGSSGSGFYNSSSGTYIGPLANELNANKNLNPNTNTATDISVTADGYNVASTKLNENVSTGVMKWTLNPLSGKWKLNYNDNLSSAVSTWVTNSSDGAKYCFDSNGEMVTGWLKDADGAWYFLETEKNENEGKAQVGATLIKGLMYFFGSDARLLINHFFNDVFYTDSFGILHINFM